MIILKGTKWDPGSKCRVVCRNCSAIERINRSPGAQYVPPPRSSTLCIRDVVAENTGVIVPNVLCAVCDFCSTVIAIHDFDKPRYLGSCGFNEVDLVDTSCRDCLSSELDLDGDSVYTTSRFGFYICQCARGHIWLAHEVVGRVLKKKRISK